MKLEDLLSDSNDKYLCREIKIGERCYRNILLTPIFSNGKILRIIMSRFTNETANTVYINEILEIPTEMITKEDL